MEEYYEEQSPDAELVTGETPPDQEKEREAQSPDAELVTGETPPDQEKEREAQSPDAELVTGETPPDQEKEREAQAPITMGDLLDEVETPLYSRPKRGHVVEGVVVQIDSGAILVDIGAKLDGFIHPNEVAQLQRDPETCPQVDDRILVYVVQPANKDGHAVLSLSRAQAERDWRVVQQQYENKELLELQVMGYNKGGLIVRLGEVRGFVPATQLDQRIPSSNRPEERMKQLSKWVGQTLKLKIIELDRSNNRLILSERLAMREWREQERLHLLDDLREGETRKGRVSGLCDFGAFVDIGGADGLVHLSELSWDQVPHPRNILRVGDEVEVYVLNVDRERKRIALSIKRTKPEPWINIHQRYQVGQIVTGRVTKLASFGAFVRLEEGIEGLAHISELSMRRVQHPKEVVQEGEELEFRIIRIDSARRRMRLSLRQLEEEAATKAGGRIEEDVPTPEALTKGRKRRRRTTARAAAEPPREELAEWQERLREYQHSLPSSPAGEPETPAPAEAEPAEEAPAPSLAVVEVTEEPKAVVELMEEPRAVVKVPTEEPAEEVVEPVDEAEEPTAEVEEPAVEVEEPAAEVEEPVVEVEEPTAEVEEPAAEVEEPAAEVEEPAAEVEEPAAEVEEPAAEVEEPAAEVEEPAAEVEEPAAEVEEPAAEVEEPAAEVEEPAVEVEEPTAEVEEPAAEVEEPAAAADDQ